MGGERACQVVPESRKKNSEILRFFFCVLLEFTRIFVTFFTKRKSPRTSMNHEL